MRLRSSNGESYVNKIVEFFEINTKVESKRSYTSESDMKITISSSSSSKETAKSALTSSTSKKILGVINSSPTITSKKVTSEPFSEKTNVGTKSNSSSSLTSQNTTVGSTCSSGSSSGSECSGSTQSSGESTMVGSSDSSSITSETAVAAPTSTAKASSTSPCSTAGKQIVSTISCVSETTVKVRDSYSTSMHSKHYVNQELITTDIKTETIQSSQDIIARNHVLDDSSSIHFNMYKSNSVSNVTMDDIPSTLGSFSPSLLSEEQLLDDASSCHSSYLDEDEDALFQDMASMRDGDVNSILGEDSSHGVEIRSPQESSPISDLDLKYSTTEDSIQDYFREKGSSHARDKDLNGRQATCNTNVVQNGSVNLVTREDMNCNPDKNIGHTRDGTLNHVQENSVKDLNRTPGGDSSHVQDTNLNGNGDLHHCDDLSLTHNGGPSYNDVNCNQDGDFNNVDSDNFDTMSICVMDDDFIDESDNVYEAKNNTSTKLSKDSNKDNISHDKGGDSKQVRGSLSSSSDSPTKQLNGTKKYSTRSSRSVSHDQEDTDNKSTYKIRKVSPPRPPIKRVSPPRVDSKWRRSTSVEEVPDAREKLNNQRGRRKNDSESSCRSNESVNSQSKDSAHEHTSLTSTNNKGRPRGGSASNGFSRNKWNSNRGKQYYLRPKRCFQSTNFSTVKSSSNSLFTAPKQLPSASFSLPLFGQSNGFAVPPLTQNKCFSLPLSKNFAVPKLPSFPLPLQVNQQKPAWVPPLFPPIANVPPQQLIHPIRVDTGLPSEDMSVHSLLKDNSKRFVEGGIQKQSSTSITSINNENKTINSNSSSCSSNLNKNNNINTNAMNNTNMNHNGMNNNNLNSNNLNNNNLNNNNIRNTNMNSCSMNSNSTNSTTMNINSMNSSSMNVNSMNSSGMNSSSMNSNIISNNINNNINNSINNNMNNNLNNNMNNNINRTMNNNNMNNNNMNNNNMSSNISNTNIVPWKSNLLQVGSAKPIPGRNFQAEMPNVISNPVSSNTERNPTDLNNNTFNTGSPPANAHQLDPKEILREPFHNEKDIKKAWWNIWVLKYLHVQYHRLTDADLKAYQGAIEDFLLNLKDHISPENADVAFNVIELKRSLFGLRAQDLLYFTVIQAEVQNFERAFGALKELHTAHGVRSIKKDDMEKLVYVTIEARGGILLYWDDLKEHVIYSESVMDKLFSVIPFETLQGKVSKIDLAHCYQQMISGRMSLSIKSKTIFLKLFSESATLVQMVDLLKEWPNLTCVPLVTVEKILTSIQCFSDILGPLNVLRRLPEGVAAEAGDSWNALLLNCFKQGDQYIQAGEQIFSLMKKYNIQPTLQASIHMLSTLCTSDQYELFVSRFDYVQSLDIFPDDYQIPDWFAQKLSELLDCFTHEDINILLKLVTFSLRSSIQPNEEKVIEVINMLIVKRRYPELYVFIGDCFKTKLLLPQAQLRLVIFTLEKWTANPDASVEIYKLMRSIYPRPEQACFCEYAKGLKPSLMNCESNKCTTYNRKENVGNVVALTKEGSVPPLPDKSPYGSHREQEKSDRSFLRIAAELNENSANRWQFKQLYLEAVQLGGANNESILCGLFLGISSKEFPGKEFNIFVTLLSDIYEDENMESDVLGGISKALGRLGVRLIKYLHLRSVFGEAYEVLMVLHNHALAYARCGQPFSSLIETATPMSVCDIAVLCCDTCIRNRQYDGGLEVLNHCTFGVDDDNQGLSIKETTMLNNVVVALIDGFISSEKPEEATDVFLRVHKNMEKTRIAELIEKLVTSAFNKNAFSHVIKFESFFKENVSKSKKAYSNVITALTKTRNHAKAEELFVHGLSFGIYDKTYDVLNPLLMQAPTDLNKIELTMLIEFHLKKLRVDPYYELFCSTVQNMKTNNSGSECNLRILVVPHKDEKASEFDINVKKTMEELVGVVCHNIVPGLEVASQEEQYLEVSGRSILFWFNCHEDLNTIETNSSDKRSTLMESKRKRKIDVSSSGQGIESLEMTYVPTPKYDEENDHSSSIAESMLIKRFPDTIDEKLARRYISKIICAKLTVCMRQGLIHPGQEFADTGKNLFKLFMRTQQHGKAVYNQQIGLKVQKFVDEKMSGKD